MGCALRHRARASLRNGLLIQSARKWPAAHEMVGQRIRAAGHSSFEPSPAQGSGAIGAGVLVVVESSCTE